MPDTQDRLGPTGTALPAIPHQWTGAAADLALWHEYERATSGHQAITWSTGLRNLLAAPERTDEEIAAEEGLLLDVAERGSAAAILAALGRSGLRSGP